MIANILIFILLLIIILLICYIITYSKNKFQYGGGKFQYGGGKFTREELEQYGIDFDKILQFYKKYRNKNYTDSQINLLIDTAIKKDNLLTLLETIKKNSSIYENKENDGYYLQDQYYIQDYIDKYTAMTITPPESIDYTAQQLLPIKEYMSEWVDVYSIIAQPNNKIFIEYMENDPCNKIKDMDTCRQTKTCYPRYNSTIKETICYSKSRGKRYNIFDSEVSKVINSKDTDTKYKIVDGYRNNIDAYSNYNADWQYSLVVSSKNNTRYILFGLGANINIDKVQNNSSWVNAMNNLIKMLLEDAQSYSGMYIICGHSMGCSLMLFLAFKLFTYYNDFFTKRCICFGSGQNTFFVEFFPIYDDFYQLDNIHIYMYGKFNQTNCIIDKNLLYPYIKTDTSLTIDDISHFMENKYYTFFPKFIILKTLFIEDNNFIVDGVSILELTSEQKKEILILGSIDYYEYHEWKYYKNALKLYILQV